MHPRELLEEVRKSPSMKGLDLIKDNTTKKSFSWQSKSCVMWDYTRPQYRLLNKVLKVVVIDFGTKFNILRRLSDYGCSVIVVPADVAVQTIVSYQADGVLLSNGPGDPSAAPKLLDLVRDLVDLDIPVFGICMGHQMLSKSLSFSTSKLKFGHRGLNHPTGLQQKVEITSQNHGFVVESIVQDTQVSLVQYTHYNLNDQTLAGLAHREKPLFSVQYHPEASPGPHDSDYLFYYFVCLIKQFSPRHVKKV